MSNHITSNIVCDIPETIKILAVLTKFRQGSKCARMVGQREFATNKNNGESYGNIYPGSYDKNPKGNFKYPYRLIFKPLYHFDKRDDKADYSMSS
jgi:hypothetical protein